MQRERDPPSTGSQMAIAIRDGPGKSQEPDTPSGFHLDDTDPSTWAIYVLTSSQAHYQGIRSEAEMLGHRPVPLCGILLSKSEA